MKVRELIELLATQDPEATVIYYGEGYMDFDGKAEAVTVRPVSSSYRHYAEWPQPPGGTPYYSGDPISAVIVY